MSDKILEKFLDINLFLKVRKSNFNPTGFIIFSSLFLIVVLSLIFASATGSSNYNISNPTISQGSGNASSSNYALNVLIGEISGNASSSSYNANLGFWYTIGENTAPDTPTVSINSTDLSNKTLQDLHCYATIIDPDGNTMDVTVRWYKNGALDLTIDYNNSYANNSFFNATLYFGNTSKGENWSCAMRLYDGNDYSDWGFSKNLTILNTAPNAALVSPPQGNITTDRSPTFNWSGNDPDSDSLQYEINITCRESGSIVTVGSVYKNTGDIGGSLSYTPAIGAYLKCLSDNAQIYNWSVRAYDGEDYGSWNISERNLSIQSSITLSLPVNNINFGAMNTSDFDNTTDNEPAPFILSNDGNAEANVSVNFTDLWDSETNPSAYYQYKIRDSSGCFMTTGTQTTWANAPSITSFAINRLNFTSGYQTGCSNSSIDIHVESPEDEEPGNKSSIVTFISSLAEAKVG